MKLRARTWPQTSQNQKADGSWTYVDANRFKNFAWADHMPQHPPNTVTLKTLPWKPSRNLGLLSMSFPFRLFGTLQMLCFLHHSLALLCVGKPTCFWMGNRLIQGDAACLLRCKMSFHLIRKAEHNLLHLAGVDHFWAMCVESFAMKVSFILY